MRKSTGANGTFMLLPLAVRVLEKLTGIVDRHMTSVGAQKLSMPFLVSQTLWERTGRWDTAGSELWRLRDRHGKGFCLGPTHEEVFTDLVAREVSSHNHLPVTLYQIGTKFRDEIRPRFGLLRAREFTMKDAYSFHADAADAARMYDAMDRAYAAIFDEVGCDWVKVEADGGNIGSGQTHEFHILSDIGEDKLLHCPSCGYASNDEQAVSAAPAAVRPSAVGDSDIPSPDVVVVHLAPAELLARYAGGVDANVVDGNVDSGSSGGSACAAPKMLRRFAVAIPAGCEVNERKVAKAVACDFELQVVEPSLVENEGIPLEYVVDSTVQHAQQHVVPDGAAVVVQDVRLAQEGESCAFCEQAPPLLARRGIEVGQIFRLGTKYSKALGATFTDAAGKQHAMEMGCYGIGVSRIIAAVVESLHDNAGVVWPTALAPFSVVVLTAGAQAHQREAGQALAAQLAQHSGADVMLDDRWKARLGFKLSEAELVGYPFFVIVGRDMHPETGTGCVEVRHRSSGETTRVPVADVPAFIANYPHSHD